jgi:hypothetical protein
LDYVAVHREPALRSKANYIFRARIERSGDNVEWEQLWGRKLAENVLELCCIPFFLYDVHLGDIVLIDEKSVLVAVISSAGQRTFRVWFLRSDTEERRAMIHELEQAGPIEWSSDNLVAVSVEAGRSQAVADLLSEAERLGVLEYETGQS